MNIKLLVKVLFFILLINKIRSECPKDKPIFFNDSCEDRYCTKEEFDNETCIINNEIVKIQWLNSIISLEKDMINAILSINSLNNELIFISSTFESEEAEIERASKRYIYSLKSTGTEFYLDEDGDDFKSMYSKSFASLNGVNLKIQNKEYLFICSIQECQIIDNNNNKILYYKNLTSFFGGIPNINERNNVVYFPIINLNKENKLLLSLVFNNNINFVIINMISNDLSFEIVEKNNDINNTNLFDTEKLNCFITEQKYIECLYGDINKYYKVAIYNESLNFIGTINLDEEQFIDNDINYYEYYNCIHFKKETGIFTYYIQTANNKNYRLFMQINELIIDGGKYSFKKYNNLDKIQIKFYNNDLSDLNFGDGASTEHLKKITDTKFCYAYYRFLEENTIIILATFDFYSNDKNLIVKYYRINLPLYGIYNDCYYNLDIFIYKSFIGIEFLGSFQDIKIYKPFYIIFSYYDKEYNEKKLSIYIDLKWKISNDINIKINNNLFGYEISYKIKSVSDSLKNLKFYSVNQNKEIKINDLIDFNDSLSFDYTNINIKFKEQNFFEIVAIISEPEYTKSISLTDEFEFYGDGDDPSSYYGSKIIDEIEYQVDINCYSTCKTCNFIGFNYTYQKCLTCKENQIFCYMKNEENCYDTLELVYNYYRDDSAYCIPKGEICINEYPFEIKKTKECVKYCNYEDLINNNIIPSNQPNSITKVFDIISNKINEGTLNEEIKKDIIINGKNITVQTTTTSNQKYYIDNNVNTNLSIIDLTECEKKLGLDEPLIIIKMDINRNDSISPQVEYLIINPYTLKKADLSICEDTKVDIYVPFNISQKDLDLYNFVNAQGYNIFNDKDKFYHDVCTPFNSYNFTDVLISDRINDFYSDRYIFCEEGCEIEYININSSYTKCNCDLKKEINAENKFSKDKFIEKFDFDSYSNIRVIICYREVFSKKGQTNNYGSYFLICIIFCFILTMIIYIKTYNKQINGILEQFLIKYKIIVQIALNNSIKNEDINFIHSKKTKTGKDILSDIKEIKIKKKEKKLSLVVEKNDNFFQNSLINVNNDNSSDKINGVKNEQRKINKSSTYKSFIYNNNKKLGDKNNFEKNNKFEESNKEKNNGIIIFREDNKKETIDKNKESKKLIDIIIKYIEKGKRKTYLSEEELNTLEYKYALEIDDRNYKQYYWSLLKKKHLFILTFIANNDYNIFLLKLGLFLISFCLYLTVNAIFFSDDSIHKIYKDEGKYNFIYQIPKILYSTIISSITNFIIKELSLSQNDIIKFKKKFNNQIDEISNNIKKRLKIKFILFSIIGLIFLVFFWYYLSCFCCTFVNSQIPLIKDTLISYGVSMLYPFGLNLLPGIFRIPSLRSNNRKILYYISKIIAFI